MGVVMRVAMIVIMGVMMMVVIVTVKRQCALRARAKERAVFRRAGNDFGRAFAADMPVQADHPIRGGHDDVQLVADHQDRASQGAAQLFDLAIKGG